MHARIPETWHNRPNSTFPVPLPAHTAPVSPWKRLPSAHLALYQYQLAYFVLRRYPTCTPTLGHPARWLAALCRLPH